MVSTVEENRLRTGTRLQRTPEPCTMVIIGATGDLAHRKLVPSLYNLAVDHLLPHGFAVVGFSRQDREHVDFRSDMGESVSQYSRYSPIQPQVWKSFADGGSSSSKPTSATRRALRACVTVWRRLTASAARRAIAYFISPPLPPCSLQ